MANLKASTKRLTECREGDGNYAGVLRDAKGKIVWQCEHSHRNRESWSSRSGVTALDCAKAELKRRQPPGPVNVGTITEYGLTQKLSDAMTRANQAANEAGIDSQTLVWA